MQKNLLNLSFSRYFKLFLLALIFSSKTSFGADVAVGADIHRRLMGIEVETSAIKVKETREKLRIDFLHRERGFSMAFRRGYA